VTSSVLVSAWLMAALAQEGAPGVDQPLDAPAVQLKDGKYAGVVPGPEARNPLPQPKADPPRLVWTGFRMSGDKSQIFLQTTRPVTFHLGEANKRRKSPRTLSVFLRSCRIHLKNNARRLDTSFFVTPVAGVSARQRRNDVELTIALKHPVAAEARTEPGPDGSQFLVLEFPSAPAR
jgi:hypothetical protein